MKIILHNKINENTVIDQTGFNQWGKPCTPYVYQLIWLDDDNRPKKEYIGVRYAEMCHPNEIFREYFTSSHVVKKYIENNKNPDIIIIRKVFYGDYAGKEAHEYESKILDKVDPRNNSVLLNINKNGYHANPDNRITAMLDKYGEIIPTRIEEFKQKSKQTTIERYGVDHFNKTTESRKRLSRNTKNQHKNDKIVECPHCGKSGKSMNLKKYHFDNCLENPNADLEKLIAAKEKQKKNSIESHRKIEKLECPHCGKILKRNLAKRYHFENCLENPNLDENTKNEIVLKNSNSVKRSWENEPKVYCPYCKKYVYKRVSKRYHFENCKSYKTNTLI